MFNYLPDVEQALIDRLTTVIDVPVATRTPNPRPASYLRVFKIDGGPGPNPLQEAATFTVEAWHKSRETTANDLAMTVRAYLMRLGFNRGNTLTNSGVIARIRTVTGSAPVSLPSEDGYARYTANYTITLTH